MFALVVACFDYFSLVVVVLRSFGLVWFYYVGLLLNCFSLVFGFGVDWFDVMDLFGDLCCLFVLVIYWVLVFVMLLLLGWVFEIVFGVCWLV